MGRRGRHPDPNSKRSQAALARAKQIEAIAPKAKDRQHEPPSNLAPPAAVKARPIALRFWSAHAPALAADGRLREDQVETFGILCHLYADCEQLGEQLAAEGWITATDKGQAASPVAKLLRDSRRDYVTLARDFGLTAASAARLPQDPNSGEEEADEEDALLAKLKLRGA